MSLFRSSESRALSFQDVWGSASGEAVLGVDSSLRLIPLYSAVTGIADDVSVMPWHCYRDSGAGWGQKLNRQPMATVACTLLGFLYVPVLFNYFSRLAFTWKPDIGPGDWFRPAYPLVFFLIFVVKIADIGAYFIGSRFGRHKLIPRISPGKTWEGFIGGIAAGTAAGALFYIAAPSWLNCVRMNLFHAVFLGFGLSLVGTVGDLTESLLKRSAGAKDSGHFIPGMGGVLDVIDSLLFAAPAMYIYVRVFLAP